MLEARFMVWLLRAWNLHINLRHTSARAHHDRNRLAVAGRRKHFNSAAQRKPDCRTQAESEAPANKRKIFMHHTVNYRSIFNEILYGANPRFFVSQRAPGQHADIVAQFEKAAF